MMPIFRMPIQFYQITMTLSVEDVSIAYFSMMPQMLRRAETVLLMSTTFFKKQIDELEPKVIKELDSSVDIPQLMTEANRALQSRPSVYRMAP